MSAYWDDPNDMMNSLYDEDGIAIYEGVIVEANTDIFILQRTGKIYEYDEGTRFIVERIHVDDGMVKVRLETGDQRLRFGLDIRHFHAISEETEP